VARQFILMNAVRDNGGFRWRIDASILASSTVAADFAGVSGSFGGPALLVVAGRSPYVDRDGREAMRRHFPAARIVTIPEADHWLHVSAPNAVHQVLSEFLVGTAGSR
jgi:pimeloyl-ACP methyl ester carboxylesterase